MSTSSPTVIPQDIEDFIAHWQAIEKKGFVPGLQAFLDFQPFKLQSEVAIMDVLGPTEIRFRLFATGLSSLVGRDMTDSDVLLQFRPEARAGAARMAWSTVSQPCGYIRWLEMSRGAVLTSAVGVGLPLRHEQSGRICIVGFVSKTDRTVEYTGDPESRFLTGVKLIRWIDIGAGVPEA